MRGMEQTGRTQSTTDRLDEGIKLTTFIPVRFVRHKARKVVVEPTTPRRMASPLNPGRPTSVDQNLMAALAKAFFWQELLDTGRVKNMTELAKAEKIGLARMQKMLKLARLAPDIVEEIAREEGLSFRMALIHAEVDKSILHAKLRDGRIRALHPAPTGTASINRARQSDRRMEWAKTAFIDGRSLFNIAVRDEAKEVRPDARPQARKNRRRIRWNTLRIFSGRERRRWSRIVRRNRTVNVGQAPSYSSSNKSLK